MKKIIDLTYAHLIPERITTYASHIRDTMMEVPPVDRDLQIFMAWLQRAEAFLRQLAQRQQSNGEFQLYFGKTITVDLKCKNLEKVCSNPKAGPYQLSFDEVGYEHPLPELEELKNCHWPLFAIFFLDNGYSDVVTALNAICKHHWNMNLLDTISPDFTWNLKNAVALDKKSPCRFNSDGRFFEYPTTSNAGKHFELVNANLFDAEDSGKTRSVFVSETGYAAEKLEAEVCQNYVDCLMYELKKALGIGISSVINRTSGEIELYPHNYVNPTCIEADRIKLNATIVGRSSYVTIEQDDAFAILEKMRERDGKARNIPCGDAIWVAPIGGYAIPEFSDWSELSHRRIFVFKFHDNSLQYLKELLHLCEVIETAAMDTDIRFVICPPKQGVTIKEEEIHYWTVEELLDECMAHGFPLSEHFHERYYAYIQGKTKTGFVEYLMEPVIRRNSWTLLTGRSGCGKSWFAMAVTAALSCNAKLFWDWRKNGHAPVKVLYLADIEMDKAMVNARKTVMHSLYPMLNENFFIVESVQGLNLLTDAGKNTVNNLLYEYSINEDTRTPVNMIVIDPLQKLTGGIGNQERQWSIFRQWIEEQNRNGITVLVVHHEFDESGRPRGTGKIMDDAIQHIHIEKDLDAKERKNEIHMKVSVPKNKAGEEIHIPRPLSLFIRKRSRLLEGEKTAGTSSVWRNLSKEGKKQAILESHANGDSREQTAIKYGISIQTVQKYIAKLAQNSPDIKRRQDKPAETVSGGQI